MNPPTDNDTFPEAAVARVLGLNEPTLKKLRADVLTPEDWLEEKKDGPTRYRRSAIEKMAAALELGDELTADVLATLAPGRQAEAFFVAKKFVNSRILEATRARDLKGDRITIRV